MPKGLSIQKLSADVSGNIAQFLTPKSQLSFYHACSGSADDDGVFEQIARGIANQLVYQLYLFPLPLLAYGYIDPKHIDKTTLNDAVSRKLGSNKVLGFANYLAFDLVERKRVLGQQELLLIDGLISACSPHCFYAEYDDFTALQTHMTLAHKRQLVKIIVSNLDVLLSWQYRSNDRHVKKHISALI